MLYYIQKSRRGGHEVKKPFTLRLESDLIQAIKIQAVKEGRHVNEIIESLLNDYLKGGVNHGIAKRK